MKAATAAMRAAILFYRYALSPVLPGVCRFQPTCSAYALEAVSRFGAWKGGWLALKRIGRCHPWGGWGDDPVPSASCRHRSEGTPHRSEATRKVRDCPLSSRTQPAEEEYTTFS